MSKRCLFVGDGGVSTGFARMNHAYVQGLMDAGWDVHMLALNYHGDPHEFPFKLYPPLGNLGMGDRFGLERIKELTEKLTPEVGIIVNDPWNFPAYMQRFGTLPLVGSVAVDGMNCRGTMLNGLQHATFWTAFGQEQARLGGYQGSASIVPLGVDLSVFHPTARTESRRRCGLPSPLRDAYIIGVVGRNQPRKRLDLAMMYFAEWVKRTNNNDAYLFLHVGPTGDRGIDVRQLAAHLQIHNRVIVSEPEVGLGIDEADMKYIYGSFDAMLGVPQGEGWGLTHMEAMACGIPQMLADWAALGEWAAPAAEMIPCSSVACTVSNINVIGGIADRDATIETLERVYQSAELREDLTARGLALVEQPQYRWDAIGKAFASDVENSLHPHYFTSGKAPEPVGVGG